MILVVAWISQVTTQGRKYQLMLTDGWYQILAVTDPRMEHAISSGRLAVGYKLSICGAQLANPQQVPSSASTTLSISSNSCQIAPWDAKLGYQKQRIQLRSLRTLHEYGGAVTAIDIVVCRKYPMMYREMLSDGTIIIRNAREEEELRHKRVADAHLGDYMPSFKEHPRALLSQHLGGQHDGIQGTKTTHAEERNVNGYFKLLVCDSPRSGRDVTKQSALATLLLLDANEVLYMDICEGHRYRVLFLTPYQPKKRRGCNLYLKSTRRTRWQPITCTMDELATIAYTPRHITSCDSLVSIDPSSDIDMAVIVLCKFPFWFWNVCLIVDNVAVISVERYTQPGDRIVYLQKLLVTDQSKALVQIKLRIPVRPLTNIEGQIVAFTNVGYDMHDAKYCVTHAKTSDESEIIIKQSSTAPYIHQALIRLREWKQQNGDQLESLMRHVKSEILLT
ncbi:hypothetical protein K492DRAFT_62142 [Lichtheimia hyalospora FSU 10163]|nr:hypothetical protein K492DRAFT_62142 [Lichtheimia hyalospora FSU 10163]